MAVETAILSRVAREGPTRKQCLSKALKKAREGSVGLSEGSVYSLWEQQVQRATINTYISAPGARPSSHLPFLLGTCSFLLIPPHPSNTSSSFRAGSSVPPKTPRALSTSHHCPQ